jgi:hypothetical protein
MEVIKTLFALGAIGLAIYFIIAAFQFHWILGVIALIVVLSI